MNQVSDPRDPRRLAVLDRDATLARIGRTRRWLVAGATALTAAFAALVSSVTPHKALARVRAQVIPTGARARRATNTTPALPPLRSGSALGLVASASPPSAPTPSAPTPSAPTPSAPTPSAPSASSAGPAPSSAPA